MSTFKRCVSLLLVLGFLLQAIPAVSAEPIVIMDYPSTSIIANKPRQLAPMGNTTDGLVYSIYSGCVYITGYTGSAADLVIPDTIEGRPVTVIYNGAFTNCESLINVTIPDGVTTIGARAFDSCNNLSTVMIPASAVTIGSDICYKCDNLTGIYVEENNPNYSSNEQGILFDKEKTQLLEAPEAISGTYSISENISTIAAWAFSYCDELIGLKIPNSVTTIEYSAFFNCTSLESVTIPDSVIS